MAVVTMRALPPDVVGSCSAIGPSSRTEVTRTVSATVAPATRCAGVSTAIEQACAEAGTSAPPSSPDCPIHRWDYA